MKDFKDKIAVVTGAGSGIGKSIAERCARENMKVVLADINPESLSICEKELKQFNQNILSVVTDVSKYDDIKNLCKKTIAAYGKVNLLFNHAGIPGPIGPVWEIPSSEFEKVIQCNIMSVVYALREFIPVMLKQQDECYIVNTASGVGLGTNPLMTGYVATKHAVVALTEVLYYDLRNANANIHVSVLCPGLVATHFADSLHEKNEDSPQAKELIQFFKAAMKEKGKSPAEVVDVTFAAIKANQLYILPHISEHADMVRSRMENIIQMKNPE